MITSHFSYRRPESLAEAFELLEEHGDDARPMAGGTALVLLMRQGLVRPEVVVDLDGVGELSGISATEEGARIGATVTHREAETSPVIGEAAPLLARTLNHVATIRIRNVGTVGGNVAHADPNQDPPVTLIAHGATVTLASRGRRACACRSRTSSSTTTRRPARPSELLTAIDVPRLPEGTGGSYLKFLPRSAEDYATVSVAATVRLDEGGEPVRRRAGRARIGRRRPGPRTRGRERSGRAASERRGHSRGRGAGRPTRSTRFPTPGGRPSTSVRWPRSSSGVRCWTHSPEPRAERGAG